MANRPQYVEYFIEEMYYFYYNGQIDARQVFGHFQDNNCVLLDIQLIGTFHNNNIELHIISKERATINIFVLLSIDQQFLMSVRYWI